MVHLSVIQSSENTFFQDRFRKKLGAPLKFQRTDQTNIGRFFILYINLLDFHSINFDLIRVGMVEQNHQTYTSSQTLEHRKKEIKVIEFCCSRFSYVPFFVVTLMFLTRASANPLQSDDTVRVKETSFAEMLMNPCGIASGSRFQAQSISTTNRLREKKRLIKELDTKTKLLNASATSIYTTNVFDDCSTLPIPEVTPVPNMEELARSDLEEMNRVVHVSMLNVTAHVCFTVSQLEKYIGETCRRDHDVLLEKAKDLANKMRELLCIHRMYMVTLNEDGDDDSLFSDSYSQVLDEPLMDQPMCSRRLLRDCQTMNRAVMLLNEISKFNFTSTTDEPA
ncbi:unnamed protein product [Larinioides sclopetarius]|uniref:Uncharacterized protein n=1 Tax=Larinioides sclopetarius TaxID=280406 RepID=A0AAV1Z8R7_9ARAC